MLDRETIEAKDQRLMQQFRAIVDRKKQTAAPEKPKNRIGIITMTAFTVICLIVLPVWMFSKEKPAKTQGPVQREAVSEDVSEVQNLDFAEETTDVVEPEPRITEVTEPVVAPLSDPVEQIPSPEENKAVMDAPLSVPEVNIADIKTCQGVKNRECTTEASRFSISKRVNPTVWMTVTAENPPYTLTHVYYKDDQPYCTVPLSIRHTRTRTWSRVTVNKEKHLGVWRVDVVDDHGQVLDHVTFEVVP